MSATSNLLIILPLHGHDSSQDLSIHFSMVLMSGIPTKVEGLPGLAFFATKPCTSFKCLVNNYLAQYATMQMPTLHFHFDPTFVHSLSFRAKLGGHGVAGGGETWLISSFGPKPKNILKNHYFVIKTS
jgi:hypothetical protein